MNIFVYAGALESGVGAGDCMIITYGFPCAATGLLNQRVIGLVQLIARQFDSGRRQVICTGRGLDAGLVGGQAIPSIYSACYGAGEALRRGSGW